MARVLAKVAALAVAFSVVGGAAQAGGIDIRITTSDRAYGTVGSRYEVDDDDDFGRRRYVAPRQRDFDDDDDRYGSRHAVVPRYGYRDPSRYYGRPVPDRGYWDRHSYRRPVVAHPYWVPQPDCRIVVKRKVNDWGQVTIRQKQVCD